VLASFLQYSASNLLGISVSIITTAVVCQRINVSRIEEERNRMNGLLEEERGKMSDVLAGRDLEVRRLTAELTAANDRYKDLDLHATKRVEELRQKGARQAGDSGAFKVRISALLIEIEDLLAEKVSRERREKAAAAIRKFLDSLGVSIPSGE
jgi:hypothetical protein